MKSVEGWFTFYLGLSEHLFGAGLGCVYVRVSPALVGGPSRVGGEPIQDWFQVCLALV